MNNHCGESVGFSFRAPLGGFGGRWFCLCEVFRHHCCNSTFLLFSITVKCNDYVSFSFLFPCFFFVKDFFSIKANHWVFELSIPCVCLFHCVIATEFDYRTTTCSGLYCKHLIVRTLNMNYDRKKLKQFCVMQTFPNDISRFATWKSCFTFCMN